MFSLFAGTGSAEFSIHEGVDSGKSFLQAVKGDRFVTIPIDDEVSRVIREITDRDGFKITNKEGNPSGVEIERKFALSGIDLEQLVELFDRDYVTGSKVLVQVYVETGKNAQGSYELRVRKEGDNCRMTIKVGKGQERIEIESEISEGLFDGLLTLRQSDRKCGVVIKKRRYMLEIDGRVMSLDVYDEDNKGLFVVEVEFDSNEDALSFSLPGVFASLGFKDVTDDDSYKNRKLATNPFGSWAK